MAEAHDAAVRVDDGLRVLLFGSPSACPQTSHRRAKAYLQHVAACSVVHARPRVRVLLGREETPLHFGWVRACLQTEPQITGRYLADWQKVGRAEPEAFLEGGPRGEHRG